MIKAASFSRLQTFEACPYRAKLAFVDRIKEPLRPPLPHGKEYPNDRGNRVHDYAESFVRGKKGYEALIPELVNFSKELIQLRALYKADSSSVVMENTWLFDSNWKVLGADTDPYSENIAVRIKLDVCVLSKVQPAAIVIDYKSGKRFGNEVKHAQQTQLYGVAVALRFPEIQKITTELMYTDLDEINRIVYNRRQALSFLTSWNVRVERMLTEKRFTAKPNRHSCFFCPYKTGIIGKNGPEGTGHCSRNP